jgi:DNA-nicking Smr family endonuclease
MPRSPVRLSELGALRDALAQKEQARAEAERRARESAERDRREANVFRDAVGEVTTLRRHGRVELRGDPHPAVPAQRIEDEAQVLRESLSDDFDIGSLLDTDDALSWCAPGIGADVLRKLRGGGWKLQGELDLHGARVDEAREQLGEFLRDARKRGWRCVRVIHGKGLGSRGRQPVLKIKVRNWLAQREEVIAFCQARPADGGAGALVVLLRAAGNGRAG